MTDLQKKSIEQRIHVLRAENQSSEGNIEANRARIERNNGEIEALEKSLNEGGKGSKPS